MHQTDDIASGAWIAEHLSGWGKVGGVVPRGFEAYARIFHPTEARRVISSEPLEVETRMVTWTEVAETKGTAWHPAAQWGSLSTSQYGEIDLGDGWELGPPDQGRLPLDQLAAVSGLLAQHTGTPSDSVVGIWAGWGELHPGTGMKVLTFTRIGDESAEDAQREAEQALLDAVSDGVARAAGVGPTLELPGREYVLLAADVRELTDESWAQAAGIGWRYRYGPTPNILWPADRAWFLGSEIDFDSTLVGGTRALIEAIVAHPQLEAAEVTADTDLTIFADAVNPPAVDP